jgi:hypothetical protein
MFDRNIALLKSLLYPGHKPSEITQHFNIVLDWDDTLNDTYIDMREENRRLGGDDLPDGVYLTEENTGGRLSTILAESKFMGVRRVREGNDSLTAFVKWGQARGIRFIICTHRGFHKDAATLSEPAFNTLEWTPDEIIILDPAVNGDKVAFLTERFPEGFVIADDRPRWDDQSALPDNVYLMDQPWNRNVRTAVGRRVRNLDHLVSTLVDVYSTWLNELLAGDAMGSHMPWNALIYAHLSGYLSKRIPSTYLAALQGCADDAGITLGHYLAMVAANPDYKGQIPLSGEDRYTPHEYLCIIQRLVTGAPIVPIDTNNPGEWREHENQPGRLYSIRDTDLIAVAEPDGWLYMRTVYRLEPYANYTGWISGVDTEWEPVEPNEVGLIINPPNRVVQYVIDGKAIRNAAEANDRLRVQRDEAWQAIMREDLDHRVVRHWLTEIWSSEFLSIVRDVFGPTADDATRLYVLSTLFRLDCELDANPEQYWGDVFNTLTYDVPGLELVVAQLRGAVSHFQRKRRVERVAPKTQKLWAQFGPNSYIVNTQEGLKDAYEDWCGGAGARPLNAGPRKATMDVFTGPSILNLHINSDESVRGILTPIAAVTEALTFM